MKMLIAEDDFVCRKVLQKMLSAYGECDVAVNGREAIAAFRHAASEGKKYNLICLDIMMPDLDGQNALKEIRKIEYENGIRGTEGTKVVMTTALNDSKNVMQAFKEQCDGYLVKPIEKNKLVALLTEFGIIKNPVVV
jgi:two-component system chemotaxis response regulator CheY